MMLLTIKANKKDIDSSAMHVRRAALGCDKHQFKNLRYRSVAIRPSTVPVPLLELPFPGLSGQPFFNYQPSKNGRESRKEHLPWDRKRNSGCKRLLCGHMIPRA